MNQSTLQNVVTAAKNKAANSPAWTRCLDKAAKMLASGELVATVLADGVLVTSPRGSYLVRAGHCPCRAMTPHCYHRCAARIAILMDEQETAPAVSRASLIADIKAAWPKDVNLADELMRRFKKNRLEMLSIDFLMAVKAAIA